MQCPQTTPPKSGEGLFWKDPISRRTGVWQIQRVEHYRIKGCPPDGIPKLSRADGAVWLAKITDFEESADEDNTKSQKPWRSLWG